jgi:ABC-type phosphate transport system ATPase subunit
VVAVSLGVFKTSDPAAVKSKVNDYLTSLKETAQMYNPEEAFKIDHAIIKEASDQVVVVIADDMEQAQKIVDSVLN